MDLLVEAAVRVNRRLRRPPLARRASDDAYSEWEYESGRALFLEYFDPGSLANRRVLDAACGLGGKTVWYAEAGAAVVFGVDLELANLRQTRAWAARRAAGTRVSCLAGDVLRLPLRDACVDVVTANDAMEHFAEPEAALAELSRVVRPGGRLFITFPPYGSAHGAHLYDYIGLPWCQLLLPRRALYATLERSIRETEHQLGHDDDARVQRIKREQIEFFEHALNRITVGRFVRMVRAEPRVQIRRLRCVPPKLKWLEPLASLPGLREVLAGLVVAELERIEPAARAA